MTVRILVGDCLDVMPTLGEDSFDAIITDPPYHLINSGGGPHGLNNPYSRARAGARSTGFMGTEWDGGDIAHDPNTWMLALRVAKPGAHLLAFGGTRTFHRLACAVEDAGWELRDTIMWVYGSGFPKSHSGAWGGTALKPAWEPIIVARKRPAGTVERNCERFGTGGLNIDECRVEASERPFREIDPKSSANGRVYAGRREAGHGFDDGSRAVGTTDLGRWPANLIHDGSDEVLACFPEAPGQLADASLSSEIKKTQNTYGVMRRGRGNEPSANSENEGAVGYKMKPGARRLDSGSAARFFYCAKASRSDRGDGNDHPTVKPTALMRYLCRLVTPSGGHVLDIFAGSGSTGRAAVAEGLSFTGIEKDEGYAEMARKRILGDAPLFAEVV